MFIMVRAVEQFAPVAIAIGRFEYSIGDQIESDVALGECFVQQIATADIASMRKMRRYFRARRQRQSGRPLPRIGALDHAGGPVELYRRQRDHRSTSPNTMSSEPRMAETSAKRWPLQMKSIACRWAKTGARILHLCDCFVRAGGI